MGHWPNKREVWLLASGAKNSVRASGGSAATVAQRVAFVTIGQSPRDDVVPDILRSLDVPIESLEYGILDGVSRDGLFQASPGPNDPALLTRLRDGTDVVLSMDWTSRRVREVYRDVAVQEIDLIVLMSTILGGAVAPAAATVYCDRVIDRAVAGFVRAEQKVGIVLPLKGQDDHIAHGNGGPDRGLVTIARPGDRKALSTALKKLGGCDIIMLHSVSYSEAESEAAKQITGKPVVLARHLVVNAIRDALACLGARIGGGRILPLSARLRLLSKREREIMFLVADGLSNKEIATQFGISFRTVEIHRSRMMAKMAFRSMTELIRTTDSLSEF